MGDKVQEKREEKELNPLRKYSDAPTPVICYYYNKQTNRKKTKKIKTKRTFSIYKLITLCCMKGMNMN